MISPMKKLLPRRGWMSMVFLPMKPKPACWAWLRSNMAGIDEDLLLDRPPALCRQPLGELLSRSSSTLW